MGSFQRGLVKQICVSSNQIAGGFSRPYIRLLPISHENGFRARVEPDVKGKSSSVSRKAVNICQGSDLFKLSGERELYKGFVLSRIDCTKDAFRQTYCKSCCPAPATRSRWWTCNTRTDTKKPAGDPAGFLLYFAL